MIVYALFTLILFSSINCHQDPHIVIIGAGASGIAAATRLYQNGFKNITVLEAEDRIGGRIYSLKLGDAYFDLGAQWCHGEKNNVVYEMVKDLNVLQDDQFVPLLYHSKRKALDREFAVKIVEIFQTTYGDNTLNAEGSLGEHLTKGYREAIREAWKNDSGKLELAEEYIEAFRLWVESYEAAFSWFDVAASSSYEDCEGNQALSWDGLGYKTILDVMMLKFPKSDGAIPIESKTVLSKEVMEAISTDEIQVKCADGTSYTGDHVIWTPSIGVLKHNHNSVFKPKLSDEKVIAIQTLRMDALSKIILHFPVKWWNDDFQGVVFGWTRSDRQKSGSAFPYGPMKGTESWITKMESIVSIPKNPHLLAAWFAGDFVSEIERTSDEIIVDGIMYTLQEFMAGDYPNITRPDKVIRKNWYNDPHFHGTYSFDTVESRKLGRNQREVLAEPIRSDEGKPILLFAGEATNPKHYSTVHGAIESGYREADRLIHFYQASSD